MASIVKKALEGNRSAMTDLYKNHAEEILHLGKLLLGSQEKSISVASWVFSKVWGLLGDSGIDSENGFRDLLLQLLASYCKKHVSSKAFEVTEETTFGNRKATIQKSTVREPGDVLSAMEPLSRFVYVFRNIAGCSDEQTAELLKLNAETVSAAAAAEKKNIEEIIEQKKPVIAMTVESIEKSLAFTPRTAGDLGSVDDAVFAAIDQIAAPLEKASRTKGLKIALAALVVLILAILAALMFRSCKKDMDLKTSVPVTPTYYADIQFEGYGTVTVALDENIAPETVQNFVSLSQQGFYDGLTIHRIQEGFVIQGGDPYGIGYGGSGTSITGEFAANGIENPLSLTRGVIAMARGADDYNSASSQFFILLEDAAELDGQYASFGVVTKGMAIIDRMVEDKHTAARLDAMGSLDAPDQPVMTSIKIREGKK